MAVTADEVRALALSMPEATEVETWAHPTFRLGTSIFVGLDDAAATATLKAGKETQTALVSSQPQTFSVAAHVGRHGWVTVDLRTVDGDELRELVVESWRLVANATQRAAYDAG